MFREKFKKGLLNRNKQDYEIIFIEKKTPRFYKIYNFNKIEFKELRKYFENKLIKGYIRRLKLLIKYLIIFMLKKNGKL